MTSLTSDQVKDLLDRTDATAKALDKLADALKASPGSAKEDKTVAKPAPFHGKSSEAARKFLLHFEVWAKKQPSLTPGGTPDVSAWITSFLSLLEGEASTFANAAFTELLTGTVPFGGDWDKLKTAFRTRFVAANDTSEARRQIDALEFKGMTLAKGVERFKELAERTGYGEAELMERLRKKLSKTTKMLLLVVAAGKGPPTNLKDYYDRCVEVDELERNDKAEDQRTVHRAAPVDPYAMDIDAARAAPAPRTAGNGRSRADFVAALRGRCFGCGATGHNKADCTESRNSTCRYCARRGHSDRVCQDRFMGLERNRGAQRPARVAATVGAPFSLFSEDGMAPPAMPVAPAAAPAQQVAAASHMIAVPPNVDPGLIERLLASLQDF